MNPVLDNLIGQFRVAQDIGVATLTEKLKIPRPPSNREWPFMCIEQKINNRCELQGIGIYSHGYGIEMKIASLTIDFDWGENGEPDGFDTWRLYKFALVNSKLLSCTYESIKSWIDDALAAGELTRLGTLYYDLKRRASGNNSSA